MSTLTPADVAADLQVSVYTAVEYMRSGTIPAAFQVVERGPWRIDADAYAAWKASKATSPADPYRIEPRSSRSEARRKP